MRRLRAQAERFGADLRPEDVEAVDLTASTKRVIARGATHRARAVILAMGAAPRYLDVPGERELLGRGVSSCATCDGFLFRGHDIAVVGGGDSAMEEATFLSRFARSITIVHRREEFRASRIMATRAHDDPKIRFLLNREVLSVDGDGVMTGVTVRDTVRRTESSLDVTGMFVAIGHEPEVVWCATR